MKRPFSAWKEGAIIYLPWLATGTAFTYFTWPEPAAAIGILLLLSGAFALYFFRDPPRRTSADDRAVVSPADGKVVAIEDIEESPHYEGPCRRVAIFLSILDVHINRTPAAGTVRSITYQPGRFLAAMKSETSECNEAMTVHLDTAHGPMTVRQIAGLIARRIVCRTGVGDSLDRGEKFGMIKFGSRTELYLPPGTEICVEVKDKVRAGHTVMARCK